MTRSAADGAALAWAVVNDMLAVDSFSRWLGIEILEAAPGRSRIRMTVRDEMVNGFGTSHGGIVFSFADSALAFCCNAGGFVTVAVDCSVSFTRPVRPGDTLEAVGTEESTTNTLAFCGVTVRNQFGETVGHFRGTVHRTRHRHAAAERSHADVAGNDQSDSRGERGGAENSGANRDAQNKEAGTVTS